MKRPSGSGAGGGSSPLAAAGLCAAFAGLYALGMPGYGVPGFPFVCLAPLIALASSSDGFRKAALRGFLAGTAANLLLYYWISYTVAVPGRLGWPLGGLAALLVSAYLAVYISLASGGAHALMRRFGARGLYAFPVLWTGLEYGRGVLLTGFPWMLLGYGVADRPLLRQAADLAGVHGIGFLLALTSVCAYGAARSLAERSYAGAARNLAGAAAVVLFLLSYGAWRSSAAGAAGAPGGPLVGIAQGGIDQSVKWDPDYQRQTVEIYRVLSREARARGADVIVWPETAAPFFYGWEPSLTGEVDRVAREAGVPTIFGAPWFDPSGGGKYYNSVFILDGRGVATGRYDKRHLVPFGEYIPLKTLLFFLRKMTAGEVDFTAGAGPALFTVRGEAVGASVCYEAVFPGIIRDSVRGGARWLVNVTNDAWFGDTVAPRQHLAMARMRSVEFRRPMVRAANAGISAVIDAKGEVTAALGLFRRGTVVAPVRPGGGETPYSKTGDIFGISCAIISVFILLFTTRGTDGYRPAGGKNRRTRIPPPRAPGLPLR